ncbi:thiamine ABC transporter permease [Vibrio vulnificus]|uniref:ABC transporter permease n=1 Tax=Vibrio vulnificus TaxID=672 RepID=UPI0011AEFB44|nr:thiamine ABC transporter permease [Vibrio vulnificus]EIO3936542.1 thiamine ABC transporter permease [Vibrio vulnificus]EKZ9055755.1 thiamine ABC transporter permease [Vibrio vulnificus]MCU8393829.1 thiamine ABC transporter permease [Vibrio vulnificus]MCU8536940.1 thiamine ABC transporter permease [Vibrio vulnificus]MCU8542954.1 thiamine ABC transporter permease [Vibrio vulnificus]
MFRAAYLILILVCIAPVIPGLFGVLLSSFGYIPPVGLHQLSSVGFDAVFNWTGVEKSIALTVFSALFSTYLACLFTFAILQALWQNRHWKKVESLLSPLLAMPHVAFAIGFAFLFSPTGLVARVAAQTLDVGLSTDDNAWFVNDPYALGLTIALALKEIPFLLLMSVPVLQQLNVAQLSQVSASMGYSPAQFWWKTVLPQWLQKMRFPLFAVMAYGVAVVDLSLILGPTNPATFAVLVWQWFSDPELELLPRAAAGAIVLFVIASLLMAAIVLFEKSITGYFGRWQYSGRFGFSLPGKTLFAFSALLALTMFPLMLLWSFAHRWRFPDLLPSRYSDRFWQAEWQNVLPTVEQSLLFALATACVTVLLALVAHEYRDKHRIHLPGYVIALPMLIPQLSILFGLQIATLYLSSDAYSLWVLWSHVFFAFPLVYLALDGPWRSYNHNYTRAALSLGKAPIWVFIRIKMPILMPAILYAWAVGASVSLAQYLPTQILGAGRITTITTEAVALSSGSDRRVTAIYALWQAILPFVFFSIALFIGHLQTRRHHARVKDTKTHDVLSRKPRHP